MREFKFRAYDKRGKEMAFYSPWTMLVDGIEKEEGDYWPENYKRFPSDFVQMQYTGLKDKNGNEIYEGDLIKFDDEIQEVKHERCYEGNSYPMSGFIIRDYYNNLEDVEEDGILREAEIIGNIYQNPELLK